MKSILIVYATREGQTQKVARVMEEHLTRLGALVKLHHAGEEFFSDIENYDLIVFGASMHVGGIEQELIDFMVTHKEKIIPKSRAFFLVLLSAATKDPKLKEEWLSNARYKVEDQIPLTFDHIQMIAGALKYSLYSWPLKLIMRNIAKQAGEDTNIFHDYEYTNWDQVKQYAEGLYSRLNVQTP